MPVNMLLLTCEIITFNSNLNCLNYTADGAHGKCFFEIVVLICECRHRLTAYASFTVTESHLNQETESTLGKLISFTAPSLPQFFFPYLKKKFAGLSCIIKCENDNSIFMDYVVIEVFIFLLIFHLTRVALTFLVAVFRDNCLNLLFRSQCACVCRNLWPRGSK